MYENNGYMVVTEYEQNWSGLLWVVYPVSEPRQRVYGIMDDFGTWTPALRRVSW